MNTSLIASLAFLKVNCDSNKNGYLDNFIPLVAESLKDLKENIVTTGNLQNALSAHFGICIPHHVIKALMNRASKRGYLTLQNHVYYRNNEKLANVSIQVTQQKIQRVYNALIEDFCSFSHEKYNVTFSPEQAEELILSFLSHNQVKIFLADSDFKVLPDFPALNKTHKVIVSDYIQTAYHSKPQEVEYIETIAKGYMIVNALYLPNVNNSDKKFQKTKIFFDTSFLIFALGYSGEEMKAPCLELLSLLYTSGAQLCCFRHTIEEIKGILKACSARLGRPDESSFGRSIQFFTSRGFSTSDVQLLISTLERNINSLHIQIYEKPSYADHTTVIDEERFTNLLKEKIGYKRDYPLLRDVSSISSIYRLRAGESYYAIEDTRAIFVTTNNNLAQVANSYYYETNDPNTISPCTTDYTLTNILWLKIPTKAPSLPIKRVIADCYAAIQPDDELMLKWLREIDKLQTRGELTQEDYYFMRYSDEVRISMMEISFGESDAITEGSVAEILDRARKRIVEETEEKLKTSEANLQAERGLRSNAENRINNVTQANDAKELLRQANIRNRAHKIANSIAKVIKGFSLVVLIWGGLLSIPYDVLNLGNINSIIQKWPMFIPSAVFFILFILNLINQFTGVTVVSLINRIEIWAEERVFLFLMSITQ